MMGIQKPIFRRKEFEKARCKILFSMARRRKCLV